jgi:hypothetical protein
MTPTTKITIGESFSATEDTTSIECKADKIEHTFNVTELGAGPANAIAEAIGRGIRNINEPARSGRKLFNRSGHLADGITANAADDGEWSIVPPADRLQDPDLVTRLAELVPAITKPTEQPTVKAAIEETTNQIARVSKR